MELSSNAQEFLDRCEEARKVALSFSDPLLVYHYDSVSGDTELLASYGQFKGKIKISELFNLAEKDFPAYMRSDGKEVIEPDNLWAFSLRKSGEVTLSKVKALIKHRSSKKMYRVETPYGAVELTSDHSLISISEDRIQEVRPADVEFVAIPMEYPSLGGSLIIDLEKNGLLPRHKTVFIGGKRRYVVSNKVNKVALDPVIRVDDDLMSFFGLWIADGCFMHRKGREGVRVSCYSEVETKTIIDRVFALFGSVPTVADEGITAVTCNKALYNLMNHLGFFHGSREKRVPGWVFGMKENLIAAFLRGYFSGDGTVSKGDINATTHSDGLARDIVSLLLFFGIRARIRKDSPGSKISINAGQQKRIFMEKISFLQEKKCAKVRLLHKGRSNYPDYIPLSSETLHSMMGHLPNSGRHRLRAALAASKPVTRNFLESFSGFFPKRLCGRISSLIHSKLYWEKPVAVRLVGCATVVYDVATDEGNFVCENIVVKNTDGICSGAIAQSAFITENRKFRPYPTKKLDDEVIEKIAHEKEIVFVDLGGGNKRVNELGDVVIIDHHQTAGIEKLQANPLLFGIDGGSDLSASAATSLVFNHHFDLGVTGAVGDMQYPLKGMNRYVLERGVEAGEIEAKNDLTMYGRHSRPLLDFLAYSDEPFLPSLSYNVENCEKFLSDLGISLKEEERWKTYSELDFAEKKKLVSALAKLLIDKNMAWAAERLVGETYLLKKRKGQPGTYDASEFSTVLNACGRNSHPETGVALCLEEEGAYDAAISLLKKHKNAIREGVLFAKETINDFGPFFFIDARGVIADSIIGIVCGMVSGGRKKPVLGAALSESGIKVSSRGTNKLVDAGLNLGAMMNCASEKVGGIGGGHRIAAGANIPEGTLNPFLAAAAEFLRQ